jgi:hypothetical protein
MVWYLVFGMPRYRSIGNLQFLLPNASVGRGFRGRGSWAKDDGNFRPLDKEKLLAYRIPQE